MLENRRGGGSLSQLQAKVGKGRKKIARVQFTIAEAMRFQAREQLANATSIAVYQDGSGAELVMRYAASDDKMRTIKGVAGIGNHVKAGGGASGIAKTTQDVINRFCTYYADPPTRSVTAQAHCTD